MTVTDIDLAGRVLAGNVLPGNHAGLSVAQEVRIVEHISFPKMKFTFELVYETEAVLLSGENVLKSMGLQRATGNPPLHLPHLDDERYMLKKWFNEEINLNVVTL